MNRIVRLYLSALAATILVLGMFPASSRSQELELRNDALIIRFGDRGLKSIADLQSKRTIQFASDEFSLRLGDEVIDSTKLRPQSEQAGKDVAYEVRSNGYRIRVVYKLQNGRRFVEKKLEIVESPSPTFTLSEVQSLKLALREPIRDSFTPEAYLPQMGISGERVVSRSADHQFGVFLRLQNQQGLMLTVQNPFLRVKRDGASASVAYRPNMPWNREWGTWTSDVAVVGVYQQSGRHLPARMTYEWKAVTPSAQDGPDENEVSAFTECVRSFLLHPPKKPISVEVGWTLNDYQIDVATSEGRAEYKRVMDTASDLGIQTLLYAPSDSTLASMKNDADDWNWEHVLWFGLGQKIRQNEWDVGKSPIPSNILEMLGYAKSKHLGVLAYVYPSLPFAKNSTWIVNDPSKKEKSAYATLASRGFQDFLTHELIAFKRRTGIAGYSFDYMFLDLPGSSEYAQWYGWRRVMESLREAEPGIIIDGRQTYQQYGPWSWLAGNYPHPTGNDEQPESFTDFPDLHFDRVSADRMRFVNYWYRNYQFAPHEVVPGYMTHQTARSRNAVVDTADGPKTVFETVYTGFRRRDWDYLGFQYSVLSSIATAGWNNVVSMIPGRDVAEFERFSIADKTWIHDWLKFADDQRETLKRTRTILGQPGIGRVDGTAAISRDHGFVFLFNPNYKSLPAEIKWDASIGVGTNARFFLRELYPGKGKLIARPEKGLWSAGDVLSLKLKGTSATVLELVPVSNLANRTLVFGASSRNSENLVEAALGGETLRIEHAAGEVGSSSEVSALLEREQKLKSVEINGKPVPFAQHGRYVSATTSFEGAPFAHSQEIALHTDRDGSLTGTFTVPARVRAQLAKRRESWPIPWTQEDYKTTWLVPERLLLFLQMSTPNDAIDVQLKIDGSPINMSRAYASVREDPQCFVGQYADLSTISVDTPHTVQLMLPKLEPGQLQGLFFDNVEDEYTEQLAQ